MLDLRIPDGLHGLACLSWLVLECWLFQTTCWLGAGQWYERYVGWTGARKPVRKPVRRTLPFRAWRSMCTLVCHKVNYAKPRLGASKTYRGAGRVRPARQHQIKLVTEHSEWSGFSSTKIQCVHSTCFLINFDLFKESIYANLLLKKVHIKRFISL